MAAVRFGVSDLAKATKANGKERLTGLRILDRHPQPTCIKAPAACAGEEFRRIPVVDGTVRLEAFCRL